jgi:hypothetical protein
MSKLVLTDLEHSEELDAAALCDVLGGGHSSSIKKSRKRDKSPSVSLKPLTGSGVVTLNPSELKRTREFNSTARVRSIAL